MCSRHHVSPVVVLVMSVSSPRRATVVELTVPDQSNHVEPDNITLSGLRFRLNQSVSIVVDAVSVGRTFLVLEISSAHDGIDTNNKRISDDAIDVRYTSVAEHQIRKNTVANVVGGRRLMAPRSGSAHLLAVIEYHLTVSRRRRRIDDAFFWVVATATLINAFGLGCVTVYSDVKHELRKLSLPLIATVLCQFVVLPPVFAFSVSIHFSVTNFVNKFIKTHTCSIR